ncbi:MAG: DinB family protein [Saprospiraceae bacterium]
MLIVTLQTLFRRELEKLKQEISQYQAEHHIWKIDKNIANSAGNLCLHLVGNLNHFIGKILGDTDYVRDREAEFSSKDIPQATLVQMIEDTIITVEKSLGKLNAEALQKTYPVEVFGYQMTTEFFLVHLAMHLDYHLGQINYHRRLLDGIVE